MRTPMKEFSREQANRFLETGIAMGKERLLEEILKVLGLDEYITKRITAHENQYHE